MVVVIQVEVFWIVIPCSVVATQMILASISKS